MLARVFIGNAEVGMAVLHGLPCDQSPRTYTYAESDQLYVTETLHQHKEIRCDLYCKTYLVDGASPTSDKHIKKFSFREYMTGELYHGYTYVSGSAEFGSNGFTGRDCRFVSGESVIPSEEESIYPVGFPQDSPCKNLVEIQQQGEIIAAMSPEGEITIFKEDFQRAAEYLAQCFGPPLFSGPILKMPQEEAPKEEEVQGMIPFEPGIFEEKIDGYTEGWDF